MENQSDERRSAILALPEAIGVDDLAHYVSEETEMSCDEAAAMLAAARRDCGLPEVKRDGGSTVVSLADHRAEKDA